MSPHSIVPLKKTKPLKDFPFFPRKKREIGPNFFWGGGTPPLVKKQTISRFVFLKASLRTKCEESAYRYLMKKRGKKGMQIIYQEVKMSEYILPNEQLSIDDQRDIFALRNKMTYNPSVFLSEKKIIPNVDVKQKKQWNMNITAIV